MNRIIFVCYLLYGLKFLQTVFLGSYSENKEIGRKHWSRESSAFGIQVQFRNHPGKLFVKYFVEVYSKRVDKDVKKKSSQNDKTTYFTQQEH